jgi:hypothetical protein
MHIPFPRDYVLSLRCCCSNSMVMIAEPYEYQSRNLNCSFDFYPDISVRIFWAWGITFDGCHATGEWIGAIRKTLESHNLDPGNATKEGYSGWLQVPIWEVHCNSCTRKWKLGKFTHSWR